MIVSAVTAILHLMWVKDVDLSVFLRNVGSETAYSVTGSLASTHPSLTITGNPQLYGDMAFRTDRWTKRRPFNVSLGSVSGRGDRFFHFTIEITSGDSTWIGWLFRKRRERPCLLNQVGLSMIPPVENGKRPDPMQAKTVELTIVIQNSGNGRCQRCKP